MSKKFDKFKEKARETTSDFKDQVKNYADKHLMEDLHKVGEFYSKEASSIKNYIENHAVGDLHNAGEAINKGVDAAKDFVECVEFCSSGASKQPDVQTLCQNNLENSGECSNPGSSDGEL